MRQSFILLASLLMVQAAVAQESTAIAVEGWRQQVGNDGAVYFRCASAICAAGSVVSYKAQPHRTGIKLQDFVDHHRKLAQSNKGTGRIRDVQVTEPRERTVDGVSVLQIGREVAWTDGTTSFSIEARLIGPERSYSLVSDSPQRDWTTNNFEGFLKTLVVPASIKAPAAQR